ncbi:hypothetical protein [Bacillus bombysepticus]|uniref:hypothetical protein n=1 Tax=Bacillus bombysepticus TaxID=658666 RepID=UPI003016C745
MLDLLTTGEKRSVTTSMKKTYERFFQNHSINDFVTKEELKQTFFKQWIKESLEQKSAWNKTTKYHENPDFYTSLETKIEELLYTELKNIPNLKSRVGIVKAKKIKAIRSKKKRIQKKHSML